MPFFSWPIMAVAPCTGAWIETAHDVGQQRINSSPLAQGRGLKHGYQLIDAHGRGRPLHRGVD